LALLNDGSGGFRTASPAQSGFLVPGDGRALVLAKDAYGPVIAAAQNGGELIWARPRVQTKVRGRKVERYWGMGYLGQSRR